MPKEIQIWAKSIKAIENILDHNPRNIDGKDCTCLRNVVCPHNRKMEGYKQCYKYTVIIKKDRK